MRKVMLGLLAAAAMVALLSGGGCDTLKSIVEPVHAPPTETQLQAEQDNAAIKASRLAHAGLDEGNVALMAFGDVINSNIDGKVWNKATAREYQDLKKSWGVKLDRVRQLIGMGNFADAQFQAQLVITGVAALHSQAAKMAREHK